MIEAGEAEVAKLRAKGGQGRLQPSRGAAVHPRRARARLPRLRRGPLRRRRDGSRARARVDDGSVGIEARLIAAKSLMKLEKPADAVALLEPATKLEGGAGRANLGLALAHFAAGAEAKAKKALGAALATNPHYGKTLLGRIRRRVDNIAGAQPGSIEEALLYAQTYGDVWTEAAKKFLEKALDEKARARRPKGRRSDRRVGPLASAAAAACPHPGPLRKRERVIGIRSPRPAQRQWRTVRERRAPAVNSRAWSSSRRRPRRWSRALSRRSACAPRACWRWSVSRASRRRSALACMRSLRVGEQDWRVLLPILGGYGGRRAAAVPRGARLGPGRALGWTGRRVHRRADGVLRAVGVAAGVSVTGRRRRLHARNLRAAGAAGRAVAGRAPDAAGRVHRGGVRGAAAARGRHPRRRVGRVDRRDRLRGGGDRPPDRARPRAGRRRRHRAAQARTPGTLLLARRRRAAAVPPRRRAPRPTRRS